MLPPVRILAPVMLPTAVIEPLSRMETVGLLLPLKKLMYPG